MLVSEFILRNGFQLWPHPPGFAHVARDQLAGRRAAFAVVAHGKEAILPSHFWLPPGLILVFISWPQPL
jgi:hypothetical protein